MSYDDQPFDIEQDDGYIDEGELENVSEAQSRRSRRGQEVESEVLISRAIDLVAGARPMPLSASVMISKEEVLDLLEKALTNLPTELRNARWLRKERDEYLAKTRADGELILDQARSQAEQMVQRAEVVKAAEARARKILEAADLNARKMRLETEDYCDRHLARFEIVLERTLNSVTSGRGKLQALHTSEHDGAEQSPQADAANEQFFDQDLS